MTFDGSEPEGPVIRDKRRIDPLTGEIREPQHLGAPDLAEAAPAANSAVGELEAALAERTADLQRLQAEYVNYKRRVDRDREVARESALANVLTQLLPVLDDIGRARDHDELTGGFRAVAESLERTVTGLGLVAFGEVGEEFDPRIHEALMHTYSDDVDRPICQAILQVGYRFGERVIRPARVAVAEPEARVDRAPDVVRDAESPAGGEAAQDPYRDTYQDASDGATDNDNES